MNDVCICIFQIQKNVQSTRFVVYMCDNVLPLLSKVANTEEEATEGQESNSTDLQLDILKLFAEMTHHCGDIDNLQEKVGKVYDKLLVRNKWQCDIEFLCVPINSFVSQ